MFRVRPWFTTCALWLQVNRDSDYLISGAEHFEFEKEVLLVGCWKPLCFISSALIPIRSTHYNNIYSRECITSGPKGKYLILVLLHFFHRPAKHIFIVPITSSFQLCMDCSFSPYEIYKMAKVQGMGNTNINKSKTVVSVYVTYVVWVAPRNLSCTRPRLRNRKEPSLLFEIYHIFI